MKNVQNQLFFITTLILILGTLSTGVLAVHSVSVTDNNDNIIATQSNPLSICPKPLTPQDLLITVKNTGSVTDTYTVSVDLPAGWELGPIRSGFSLMPGEKTEVNPFLISYIPPTTEPGIYKVDINAKSSNNPSDIQKKSVYIEILNCHAADLSVTDASREVCKEDTIQEKYTFTLENNGKYPETFSLSSSSSWAALSVDTLTVSSGSSKTFDLVANPPEGLLGNQEITVTASSQSSYSEVSKKVNLNIKSCYGVDAKIEAPVKSVCHGESIEYTLVIENTGIESDAFDISGPSMLAFDQTEVSLTKSETKRIKFKVTPPQVGDIDFDITVTSTKSETTVSSSVEAEECRGVVVFIFPEEQTVCGGEEVEYTVSLRNIGAVKDTFELTSSIGTLEKTSFSLTSGSTQTTKLMIDTNELSGDITVGIKAKSEGNEVSDQMSALLTVDNCYEATVNIVENEKTVCPFFESDLTIMVKNTGKLTDNYVLTLGEITESVTLTAGQERTFVLPLYSEDSGAFTETAELKSDFVTKTDTVDITVKALTNCFSSTIERTDDGAVSVREQRGATIPIKIENTGEAKTSYQITRDGPEWSYLRPITLELEPGENENVYLYVLPPFGTASGEYEIKIVAKSERSEVDLTVLVNVLSDTDPVDTETPVEPEEPVTPVEPDEPVMEEGKNIIDTAIEADNLNILVEALKAADLFETLEGKGPFTLFAPTDEAFKNLPEGLLDDLLENPEELAKILKYHIVPVDVTGAEIVDIETARTLQGTDLHIDATDDVMINNEAKIIETDLVANNGIIHAIDTVLIPTEEPKDTLVINDSGSIYIGNITLDEDKNLAGLVIGDDDRPFWKTAVVAIITIIIIVILIVRFALLLKK
ncbi:MAG: fasciclin domain-containing protein [Candidatus Aenigmatarchaeota archaeon]